MNDSKEVLIFHDDAKIAQAIVTLLQSNVGYGIEFFGFTLPLRHLDNLDFAVSRKKYDPETQRDDLDFEKIFTDGKEAADFFLRKRREYELRFDFEAEYLSETN
ncbi:MAG: hypothetical protein LUM44_06200 [Pyrinomonadaceae bacterium]|nr:hypothetical protein [Pyrinomonadaceae bacterium]